MLENHLYYFCLNTFADVKQSLADVMKHREIISAKSKVASVLFSYIEPLYLMSQNDSYPLAEHHHQLVRFLDVGILKNFVSQPEDPDTIESIVKQILYIYSATGNLLEGDVYSPEKITQILNGTDAEYEDSTFLYTLGSIMSGRIDAMLYAQSFKGFLTDKGMSEVKMEMDWKNAFIFVSVVHTVWMMFPQLDKPQQDFLLRHYTHAAFASGVPVVSLLKKYYDDTPASLKNSLLQRITQGIVDSSEDIPMDTNILSWEKLSQIAHQYMGKLGGAEPDGFTQEDFLKNYYKNEPNKEWFRDWLRKILTIFFYVREWAK